MFLIGSGATADEQRWTRALADDLYGSGVPVVMYRVP
jgi:hypothetical protein